MRVGCVGKIYLVNSLEAVLLVYYPLSGFFHVVKSSQYRSVGAQFIGECIRDVQIDFKVAVNDTCSCQTPSQELEKKYGQMASASEPSGSLTSLKYSLFL